MYPIPIPEYPGYYIDYDCNVWDKNYNEIKPEWCYYYRHRFLGYMMNVNGKKTIVHAGTINNIHYSHYLYSSSFSYFLYICIPGLYTEI